MQVSLMGRRTTVTDIPSWGVHWQEAGIRSTGWHLQPGTWMWDIDDFTAGQNTGSQLLRFWKPHSALEIPPSSTVIS